VPQPPPPDVEPVLVVPPPEVEPALVGVTWQVPVEPALLPVELVPVELLPTELLPVELLPVELPVDS
jgi:hypothetical protein